MPFTATKKLPPAATLIVILLFAFSLTVYIDQIGTSLWRRTLEPHSCSRRLTFADPATIDQKEEPVDVTDDSNLFDKYWNSEYKQKLCPNHRPNAHQYHKLIQLAKEALNFTANQVTGGQAGSIAFYLGNFGVEQFEYVSPKNNHTYNYNYVKIWKCGNNQIRFWSQKVFQQRKGRVLKADCTVTAIRDPISHFLSGYNEIEHRWILQTRGWKDWMRTVGQGLRFAKHEVGSKARFETFLMDMFSNHATKHWMFDHVRPQSGVLSRYKLTGYLPTIHNLTHDWPRFLGDNCPGMPDTITSSPMEVMGQHNSSQDPYGTYQASKEVWRNQGPYAQALCLMHAIDYACWDDLPHGIPSFCQNVYSSPSFANAMGY